MMNPFKFPPVPRRKLFAQRFGVDRPLSGKHTHENDDLSGSSATG